MSIVQTQSGAAIESLLELFNEEIEALCELEAIQKSVENAVYEKRWTDFEVAERALEKKRAKLEVIETRRISFFDKNIGDNFYLWATALPKAEYKLVTEAYRGLKLEAARIRNETQAFTAYLTRMQFVVTGFLDAAFPERKKGTYGIRGKSRGTDMRSVVLDKQF